jgi:hypothetical protein
MEINMIVNEGITFCIFAVAFTMAGWFVKIGANHATQI